MEELDEARTPSPPQGPGHPAISSGGLHCWSWRCQASHLPSALGDYPTVTGRPRSPGNSYWGPPTPSEEAAVVLSHMVLSLQADSSRTCLLPSLRLCLSVCLSPHALTLFCM